MTPDQYAVIGNPVAHSLSPQIHRAFADAHNQVMEYGKVLAPHDKFEQTVQRFIDEGGQGVNVTVPFKERAAAMASVLSDRARAAGAANTLTVRDDGIHADNTDGTGLVRDLSVRHRLDLAGSTVILLGAGGAARGVILPLMQGGVRRLTIVNRTHHKAEELAARFADAAANENCALRALAPEALANETGAMRGAYWINATSAGLGGGASPVTSLQLRGAGFVYDMMYGARPTAFLDAAREAGCAHTADGLGMLVEQAADAFAIWRGMRPATDGVYEQLRGGLS